MTAPLQFGQAKPDVEYQDRRAAFGVAVQDGKLACVRIMRGEDAYFDLPGGALDAGETEEQALIREFGEEAGLVVQVDDLLVRVRQFAVKSDGRTFNNRGGIYEVAVVGQDPGLHIEDDHTLVWLDPVDALAELRHGSHAFAVAAWLNARAEADVEALRSTRPGRTEQAPAAL